MRKFTAEEKQEAIKFLREYIYPGANLYLVLRRAFPAKDIYVFEIYSIDPATRNTCLAWNIAKVLGEEYSSKYKGIQVEVDGMDAGASVLSEICARLEVPFNKVHWVWL